MEPTELDWNALNAIFEENMRWSTSHVTIEEISMENKPLIQSLAKYDPITTVPLLAALLTLPEYQSHCIRIEILVTLAITHCRGRKRPGIGQVVHWFSEIGKSKCARGEDPAEDVFVFLVHDAYGDYRLLGGVWESAGFYTQRVLDVIASMPNEGRFGQIKKCVRALLVISDIVCEKAGLRRYQLGSEEHHQALSPRTLPKRHTLISHVTIPFAELEKHGITPDDIEPFL